MSARTQVSTSTTATRPLRFTFAVSSYDHVREVVEGRIPIEDAEPLFIQLPIPEMFRRFVRSRDWDVSEMSFGQYGMLRANGDDSIVGIPVFPSRLYRQTAIFVRGDRIREPGDLVGARIGIPAWTNSAGVWARGLLEDMHGIRCSDITWYQGGVDQAGRRVAVEPPFLPDDVRIIDITDRSLEDMLWAGDIDGMIVPAPPSSIESSAASGGLIRLLYDDPWAAEREYRERTGCVPTMHVIAINRPLYELDPDLPRRLFEAFDLARRKYLERLADPIGSRVAIPWADEHVASLGDLFGGDLWQYGVEPNRRTLETYLRYLRTQGMIQGTPDPTDLFPEWLATGKAVS